MASEVDYEKEFDELLRIVSHDLNGPLRHIRAFTDLLIGKAGDRLNEREQEYARFLLSSVGEAEATIAATLTLSRLATSTEDTSSFLLSDALVEVGAQWDPMPVLNVPQDIALHGKRQQFVSMLHALIDNAVKFGVTGSAVQVDILTMHTDQGLRLEIQDNGPGIPDGMHDKVFVLFKQGANNIEGNGLGLALCRRVCQLHGGSIEVSHSKPGRTVFQIDLPLQS